VYSRLARRDKRDPHILAWLGIDWLEQARRSVSVAASARLVVVRSDVYSLRTRRDWSVRRADWPARPDGGTERSRVHADTEYTPSRDRGRLFSAPALPLILSSLSLSLSGPYPLGSSCSRRADQGIYPSLALDSPIILTPSLVRSFESSLSTA